ncbi:MAG: zinc ribbon domain-containing protein [Pseudomonadota bacterium]|nr:zinc ribbon domain-containing protein [Pseudomonadota bacterium]
MLRPLRTDGRTQLGETGVIALVVAALLGPVLVSLVADRLPALPWLTLHWQALWLLLFALISVTLFFQALVRQLADASPNHTSCEVSRLNMNTHPAQIIGEFDRVMQEKWADKIPNRRYTRIDPEVDSSTPTGSFQGEMFEETQPMPAHALQSLSLGAALADARCRWLVYLNSFGSLLLGAAAVALLLFIRRFEADDVDLSAGQFITFAFVAFSVGRFCFEASAQLWGRFDFVSEIVWLELSGQYTTAHNRLGNDFTSTVRSESHGIHIDAMTMRVWTARIESVVFGKTARRHVIAMHGQSEVTSGLSAHLASFARERSMFVAPTNADDMHKLGAVQSAPAAAAQLAVRLQDQLAASTPGAATPNDVGAVAASDRFCAACGAVRQPAARFCSACGSKFNA